jgi:hypothetical protein
VESENPATLSVTVVLCTKLPLVPLIVSVDVPTGVEREVVIVSELVPELLTDVGVKVAVAPAGRPVTEKVTVPLNPFKAVTVLV